MTEKEVIKTLKQAVNLIESQQAKINKLERAGQKQGELLCELRKQKYELMKRLSTAKHEAYKEFVKKAKEKFQNLEYSANTDRKTVKVEEMKEQINWVLHSVAAETLDNLLKELVGDNK